MSYYRRTYVQSQPPKPKSGDPTTFGIPINVKQWIEYTTHTNPILVSIHDQLVKYGHLSEKQWQIAQKEMAGKPAAVVLPPVTLKPELPIFINRTAAFREIRDKYKLQYGVFALKMTKVIRAGKARNGNTWAELEVAPDLDSPVSCCRVCGKTLKDHRSIASGIGPDCAKRFALAYQAYKNNNIQQFLADFKKEVTAVGTMTIKLWGNQVKEHMNNFNNVIHMYMAQPAPAIASTATVLNVNSAPSGITINTNSNGVTSLSRKSHVEITMDPSKFKTFDKEVPEPYKYKMEVSATDLMDMKQNHKGSFVNLTLYDNDLISLYNPITNNTVTFRKQGIFYTGTVNGNAILLIIK